MSVARRNCLRIEPHEDSAMMSSSAAERTSTFDPGSLEVIRAGLVSISREMGVTLRQTAYSSIFNEGNDFSCGLFNERGHLIAQGEFLPGHLGALQFSVRAALRDAGSQGFAAGDAIILNDPYRGGTHVPDLTIITPIMDSSSVIGFAANRAHHADVGGTVSGSFYAGAREAYQEGLRLPPVHLYRAGELNRDVLEIILNNVRVPGEMRGDLEAQMSANRTAVSRYLEMAERWGAKDLKHAENLICDQSERRMRAVIAAWEDGEYYGEDSLDNDGVRDEEIWIRTVVQINGSDVTVDFSESSPQTDGPLNAVLGFTASATFLTIQAAADPTIPANDGCYRPVTIVAPEGSVVNPRFPAPCSGGNEVSHRIVNAIMRALAHVPSGPRVMAGDHGSSNNLFIDIRDCLPDGMTRVLYQYPEGGWGAVNGKDGESALFSITGNCKNTPAEALELRFPVRLLRYELRPDSGGAGRWRGGLGTRRDYEILADEAELSFVADRCKRGAYGLDGGSEGAPGAYLIDTGDGFTPAAPAMVSKGAQIPLRRGHVVSQRTAGGGGMGPPRLRDRALIERDRIDGYVSDEAVSRTYGWEEDGATVSQDRTEGRESAEVNRHRYGR
jgi:N-methylhydantoinase B